MATTDPLNTTGSVPGTPADWVKLSPPGSGKSSPNSTLSTPTNMGLSNNSPIELPPDPKPAPETSTSSKEKDETLKTDSSPVKPIPLSEKLKTLTTEYNELQAKYEKMRQELEKERSVSKGAIDLSRVMKEDIEKESKAKKEAIAQFRDEKALHEASKTAMAEAERQHIATVAALRQDVLNAARAKEEEIRRKQNYRA